MEYLITTTEVYRVDTQAEVDEMIERAKTDRRWILTKYNCEKKEKKQKGEVVDSWLRLSLVKSFNDEKEPAVEVYPDYEANI